MAFLMLNTLSQYLCTASVHRFTSVASSLTTNLLLTLRKFTSLMLSLYFGSTVMWGHLIGGAMVFSGTLLYAFSNNYSVQTKGKKSTENPEKQKIA
jgi:solute carrier family 35 (UDP-xylose/UDP-N-acetylglucosamine transporter), member B4